MIDNIFKDIVKTIREPLLVLDSNLMVILANHSYLFLWYLHGET